MKHRGFATFTAIILAMCIATAALAVMRAVAADARRTLQLRVDSQIEQLLFSGQIAAVQMLESGDLRTGDEKSVNLPDELPEAALHVRAPLVSDQLTRVRIDVLWQDHARSQTLEYVRRDARWKLVSAILVND